MDREKYMNSLRSELITMVADYLTPVSTRYGYSDVALESNIKWKPQVLVLGNYSSGKSTMINELLGGTIQATGQAPTDDSFTVITYDESVSDVSDVHVTEERDGKYLLNDPDYPFESLKKHGQRFAAHFRLKKVNSPFLKNLALIDTPGMHDSMSEHDRGYSYQDVIGDFARNADLILILFDPHKAGTVREVHTSLKETLPASTFEDRIIFVLNRIDECASLNDLLRVYGTLCWNLSQMIGRKDIPMIRLTYSPKALEKKKHDEEIDLSYLNYLKNQREDLNNAILQAPRFRLDHLATFVETHSERLAHFLEALINYRKKYLLFRSKYIIMGLLVSAMSGGAALLTTMLSGLFPVDPNSMILIGGGFGSIVMFFWMTIIKNNFTEKFHTKALNKLDDLTPKENQTRLDSWQSIRGFVYKYIKKTGAKYSLWQVQDEYYVVNRTYKTGTKEIREALNELASIKYDNEIISPKASLMRKEDDYYRLDRDFLTGIPINYM